MKNNLSDLNNHLFLTLETLEDDKMTDKRLEKELKKAQAICSAFRNKNRRAVWTFEQGNSSFACYKRQCK